MFWLFWSTRDHVLMGTSMGCDPMSALTPALQSSLTWTSSAALILDHKSRGPRWHTFLCHTVTSTRRHAFKCVSVFNVFVYCLCVKRISYRFVPPVCIQSASVSPFRPISLHYRPIMENLVMFLKSPALYLNDTVLKCLFNIKCFLW